MFKTGNLRTIDNFKLFISKKYNHISCNYQNKIPGTAKAFLVFKINLAKYIVSVSYSAKTKNQR